jgi:hypothetical protein
MDLVRETCGSDKAETVTSSMRIMPWILPLLVAGLRQLLATP